MFSADQLVHFVGIGGIGMSGLAEILARGGSRVTGSDLKLSAATRRLEALGVEVSEGHRAENVPADARAVVITSAVNATNPEVVEARRRGLPVVRRGELLAELMRRKRGAVAAGSHGKTTTSSMLAAIALVAGLDPTVAIGSTLSALGGSNARLGGGEWFVAESDESDGSFLELSPEVALITNIDREHLDHYGTFENARAAFLRFADRVAYHGAVVGCTDDLYVEELCAETRRRVARYGRGERADVRIVSEELGAQGSRFALTRGGAALGEFELAVLGAHNVLNACGAVAAALEMGVSAEQAREALAKFRGPGRRMEWKGGERGITVVDDYGHHPAEIRATLASLRLLEPRRLVVVFQPHRYTRTRALMDEFAGAFDAADVVRIAELYAASEEAIKGVSGEALAMRLGDAGHRDVRYCGSVRETAAAVAKEIEEGDLVVTLGAGSVTEAGPMILDALKQEGHSGQA